MKRSTIAAAIAGAVLLATAASCSNDVADSGTPTSTSTPAPSASADPSTQGSSAVSTPAETSGGSTDSSSAPAPGGTVVIGVDQPRSDSDFWSAWGGYIPTKAADLGIELKQTSSDNDANRLKSNVDTLLSQGVKGLVLAPQDTAAVAPALAAAEAAKVPVVTVDTRPDADAGKVFMVVRADNRAYGTNSCIFLGETLGGKGTVVEFQGALSSINGRDRSEAFAECMKSDYPDIKVIEIPTEWDGGKARSGLQDKLLTEDVNGIYMQAGGVFLEPTLSLLSEQGKLKPAGDPDHIAIISNDGIKSELEAIGRGDIDATISQPADAYAEWSLFYAKAAANGETFAPGKTDHNSEILDVGNGQLEDQLPAPVVTKDGADVGSLKTVASTSKDLWGNN
ncbi:sugar ABC transporter substrate-binding protein [Nakamurella silvestris]|nr:sugar ABC transporter substrate-binding protein [Nakamurella silvestris]